MDNPTNDNRLMFKELISIQKSVKKGEEVHVEEGGAMTEDEDGVGAEASLTHDLVTFISHIAQTWG